MMFRAIGGIVVYGFALYGVAALVSHLKAKKASKPPVSNSEGGRGESADEAGIKPEGRLSGVQVSA